MSTVDNNTYQSKTQEAKANLSASASVNTDSHKKAKEKSKRDSLLKKFSSRILSKILEYNLDPSTLSQYGAITKLLSLGMPIQYAVVDLQNEGKDIGSIQSVLSKNGLMSQLNSAVTKGLQARSISSGLDFANSLVESVEKNAGQSLNKTV